jgi:putative FmdB family regulatory protein
MPIYEYHCTDCDHHFDRLVLSIRDTPPAAACPVCHSDDVRRLISAPAVLQGGADGGGGEQEAAPEKPSIFGRKELNEALRRKA